MLIKVEPAIESWSYAGEALANIWLPRPQRRFRRATLLPPFEELLACFLAHRLRTAGDEATGLGKRLSWLFASCPSFLEAILDALRMG